MELLEYRFPYFKQICLNILQVYLNNYGFNELIQKDSIGVTFVKNEVYLNISYMVEDHPNFFPMVSIGFFKRDSMLRVEFTGISIWNVIKEDKILHKIDSLYFKSSKELENVLCKIRDEIFENYLKSIWDDSKKLKKIIKKEILNLEKEYNIDVNKSLIQDAECAFKLGNYKECIEIFNRVGFERLTEIQKKKYIISKKRTNNNTL